MYKVSIIIPIYNVADCVAESLLSALDQTFENIEYILVDDCSSDNSLAIIKDIINGHPRKNDVYISAHANNSGVSIARNTGLEKATGEYIFFMDSDDKLSPDCIAIHYASAIRYHSDFTAASHKIVGSRSVHKSKTISLQKRNDEVIQSYLKKEWSFSSCNKLIRKDIIIDNQLFFQKGIVHGEDILWTFRLALCAKKMICLPETTYFYIIRHNSAISSSYSSKNISSLTFVFEQISSMITESAIYNKFREEANSFITFHRFNVALFIMNNKDELAKKFIMYKKINSKELKKFDNKSILAYLLKLPLPLFIFLIYLPYKFYKRIQ